MNLRRTFEDAYAAAAPTDGMNFKEDADIQFDAALDAIRPALTAALPHPFVNISDATQVGVALGKVRAMMGVSRRQLAKKIGEATGRTETSVNAQLWTWDTGRVTPDTVSLKQCLDALGLELALAFKIENEEE